jgi:integrase
MRRDIQMRRRHFFNQRASFVNDVAPDTRPDPLRESKLVKRVLQPAAEKAGLGRVTWHQFRHIHSSLLNDLKVPAKIAQEQLGHASISTTLNIYTHVVDASHRKAIEAVEERLFGDVARRGPELAAELKDAPLASTRLNYN